MRLSHGVWCGVCVVPVLLAVASVVDKLGCGSLDAVSYDVCPMFLFNGNRSVQLTSTRRRGAQSPTTAQQPRKNDVPVVRGSRSGRRRRANSVLFRCRVVRIVSHPRISFSHSQAQGAPNTKACLTGLLLLLSTVYSLCLVAVCQLPVVVPPIMCFH